MRQLFEYINEALRPISSEQLSMWRQKVAKPEYYHEELTTNHYIRPLIKALVGGTTKVERRRWISDFIEMYFGNYISAKDGSFTLAKIKDIEFDSKTHNFMAKVTVIDKWFNGLLARFIFKLHIDDPEKYFAEKKPVGIAKLTIKIEAPVYKSDKDITWTSTRPITVDVPASIPQGDPLYMDLAKQMSMQTRDMNWGYYDPIKNRYSGNEQNK
jgi:hypothetical protein